MYSAGQGYGMPTRSYGFGCHTQTIGSSGLSELEENYNVKQVSDMLKMSIEDVLKHIENGKIIALKDLDAAKDEYAIPRYNLQPGDSGKYIINKDSAFHLRKCNGDHQEAHQQMLREQNTDEL